jgi:hypothetical protein
LNVNAISRADRIKWLGRGSQVASDAPELTARFVGLCWDGNGGWTRAHARVLGSGIPVEELESAEFSKLRMELPIANLETSADAFSTAVWLVRNKQSRPEH